MTYRVEVDNRAARQIQNLPPTTRDRAIAAVEALRTEPRPAGCVKLKAQALPAWRVRVGDYRILYRIHDEHQLVRVYGVLRRDEAYRE